MSQSVYRAFLEDARREAAVINAGSEIVHVVPDPSSGEPPSRYYGLLREVEHMERREDGSVHASLEPVPFSLCLPLDYLRSADPTLAFRVATVFAPILHPNVRGGVVCLGLGFRPGTRFRWLVEQLYRIVSGQLCATDHGFDAQGCAYYLAHVREIRRLRARPLWRRPLSARVRIERGSASVQRSREGGLP